MWCRERKLWSVTTYMQSLFLLLASKVYVLAAWAQKLPWSHAQSQPMSLDIPSLTHEQTWTMNWCHPAMALDIPLNQMYFCGSAALIHKILLRFVLSVFILKMWQGFTSLQFCPEVLGSRVIWPSARQGTCPATWQVLIQVPAIIVLSFGTAHAAPWCCLNPVPSLLASQHIPHWPLSQGQVPLPSWPPPPGNGEGESIVAEPNIPPLPFDHWGSAELFHVHVKTRSASSFPPGILS